MSMETVHKALYNFWSGFGVSAYLSGHVPENEDGTIAVEYPYITFDVEMGEALSGSILYAFDWHKATSGKNVNSERVRLLGKIAKAIPVSGVQIKLDDGYITIHRDALFQSYYDDPDDKSVIGGRTAYYLRFYTM